jgi:hypothetical protein
MRVGQWPEEHDYTACSQIGIVGLTCLPLVFKGGCGVELVFKWIMGVSEVIIRGNDCSIYIPVPLMANIFWSVLDH